MGQALREGLDEGCFQVFCNPELEGKSVPGFPTGVEGEVIPLSLRRACDRTAAQWVVVRLSGDGGLPQGEWIPFFFFPGDQPGGRELPILSCWLVLQPPGVILPCVWY